jgi:hypothetical protein
MREGWLSGAVDAITGGNAGEGELSRRPPSGPSAGGTASKQGDETTLRSGRQAGITGGAAKTQKTLPKLPPNAVKISAEDVPFCEVGPRRLRSWPS